MLFHGTNSHEAYKGIMNNGLRPGSYLTPFLDAAIAYGGQYVFAFDLPEQEKDTNDHNWQITTKKIIPISRIAYVQRFGLKLLYYGREVMHARLRHNLEQDSKIVCNTCDGRGEFRDEQNERAWLAKPGGGAWAVRKDAVSICQKCDGRGYTGFNEEQS